MARYTQPVRYALTLLLLCEETVNLSYMSKILENKPNLSMQESINLKLAELLLSNSHYQFRQFNRFFYKRGRGPDKQLGHLDIF